MGGRIVQPFPTPELARLIWKLEIFNEILELLQLPITDSQLVLARWS